jgi:hypothetical protein
MFIASAAKDTPQGRAIHAVNEKWGADYRQWTGRETIGIPVCKKKYSPFDFQIKRNDDGQVKVNVVRMYGCACHSHLREKVIKKYGERKGWFPFGVWSISKARILARKCGYQIKNQESRVDEGDGSFASELCHNGRCMWKKNGKYDDIEAEVHDEI